jgi:hypothetical protein
VDYAYGTEYTLGNGDDEIVLLSGLYEIDRINYDNGATFPDPNGYSMELIAPALDNFLGANWQTALASATYGAGDRGTPGAVNSVSTLDAPLVSDRLRRRPGPAELARRGYGHLLPGGDRRGP